MKYDDPYLAPKKDGLDWLRMFVKFSILNKDSEREMREMQELENSQKVPPVLDKAKDWCLEILDDASASQELKQKARSWLGKSLKK